MQFHDFIDKLINNQGINDFDKEDLKNEFYDHLTMLKNEYIKKGKSEDEAIKLSIQKFGESNFLGNELKNNLSSKNKFKFLPILEQIKCLILMFFLFFSITIITSYNSFNVTKISLTSLFFNFFLALTLLVLALTFITKKLYHLNNFNKTLINILILYFILEKITVFILNIVFLFLSGNITKGLLYPEIFLYKYAFSLSYIVFYTLISIVFLLVGKSFFIKFSNKLINKFNSKLIHVVLFILSMLFFIIHFMIITNPYLFYRILSLLSINCFNNIEFIKGNILYISCKNIIFPNIGFILILISLIFLMVDLNYKKKHISQ